MKYLLDANACVDYSNGRYPPVIERIKATPPEELCLSSVVIAELRYGAERSGQKRENHSRIDVFVEAIRCIDFDPDAAIAHGGVRSQLEAKRGPIGPNDLLIASHALSQRLVVVTDNVRQFRRVRGLRVENWRRPSRGK